MSKSGSLRKSSGKSRDWSCTWPSTRRRRSRLEVPGSVPTTRVKGLAHSPAQLQDLLGVEHLVVGGEQLLDGPLVDLHLGGAHAKRSPGADAIALCAFVVRLDAL